MRRILSLLSVALCTLLVCADAWAKEVTYEGSTYEIDLDTYTATLTQWKSGATGAVSIPAFIGHDGFDYTVTEIGDNSFSSYGITKVTIPNTVTDIGIEAFFECKSLESVTLSTSLTNIDEYAFSACEKLTSIVIPEGVTRIGKYAFDGCIYEA